MKKNIILGAGGAIANELAPIILSANEKLRLVSRNPKPVMNAESIAADITSYEQTLQAIKHPWGNHASDVNATDVCVYLLVGLPYDIRIWKVSWPKIMTNVIRACKETGARLIFFDNVYMYGKVLGKMTEATAFKPCSKKGEIRAGIATQLLNEMQAGNLKALIARSADFYGPHGDKTSLPNILVFDKMARGKKAQWMGNPDLPHSFTYIPDAAKALFLLSGRDDAFGQTWHLPTADFPPTGRSLINQAATALNRDPAFSIITPWMMQLAGFFNRSVKELIEMTYQYTAPYHFDSAKFNKAFGFKPTSYKEGIAETADSTLKLQTSN